MRGLTVGVVACVGTSACVAHAWTYCGRGSMRWHAVVVTFTRLSISARAAVSTGSSWRVRYCCATSIPPAPANTSPALASQPSIPPPPPPPPSPPPPPPAAVIIPGALRVTETSLDGPVTPHRTCVCTHDCACALQRRATVAALRSNIVTCLPVQWVAQSLEGQSLSDVGVAVPQLPQLTPSAAIPSQSNPVCVRVQAQSLACGWTPLLEDGESALSVPRRHKGAGAAHNTQHVPQSHSHFNVRLMTALSFPKHTLRATLSPPVRWSLLLSCRRCALV
jgi:hypothetical protein